MQNLYSSYTITILVLVLQITIKRIRGQTKIEFVMQDSKTDSDNNKDAHANAQNSPVLGDAAQNLLA